MTERILTCIICPRGCTLNVTLDEDGKPTDVDGNLCPRGKEYAITECTAPMRTVTTTIRCVDGSVIPVKTTLPVPKGLVGAVMAHISRTKAPLGSKIGDTVIKNVAMTDADVVITGY